MKETDLVVIFAYQIKDGNTFSSLHSTLPLPLCYTLLMIPFPSGHITPGRTPLHAKELNSPHSYYNPSEFLLLDISYSRPPNSAADFKSRIYFSWLYMTPITAVFQYRRFSPVGGSTVLPLQIFIRAPAIQISNTVRLDSFGTSIWQTFAPRR